MDTHKIKEITIGYNLLDWVIGIQFIKFDDGTVHFQILCLFIDW